MRKFINIITEDADTRFKYPDAGTNAAPEVQAIIDNFHNLPSNAKASKPLLYYVLGSGTPPYKMDPTDAEYKDKSDAEQTCGNCDYAYEKSATGKVICSQISGAIELAGICRLWTAPK